MQILHSWKDCGEVNSHVVNNKSFCFCEMFVSVDKIEAVPILCVERRVVPLFCMNASQSAINSLWRSVPV